MLGFSTEMALYTATFSKEGNIKSDKTKFHCIGTTVLQRLKLNLLLQIQDKEPL